jgi:hypothetical protein
MKAIKMRGMNKIVKRVKKGTERGSEYKVDVLM